MFYKHFFKTASYPNYSFISKNVGKFEIHQKGNDGGTTYGQNQIGMTTEKYKNRRL